MFRLKKEGQIGKYQPEFVDKILLFIVILALAVLILAWWYKHKYYDAIRKNESQSSQIIQLEQSKRSLLEELEKYRN